MIVCKICSIGQQVKNIPQLVDEEEESSAPPRNQTLTGINIIKSKRKHSWPYFKDKGETSLQHFSHIKVVQKKEERTKFLGHTYKEYEVYRVDIPAEERKEVDFLFKTFC